MSFIHRSKSEGARSRFPFLKRKGARIFLVILGFVLVFGVSFFGYLYATGSKIFDQNSGFSPFFKMIKGEQSNILNEDRVNIIIMGRGGDNHPGGLLTDSLMLVSIDTKGSQIALMNIPRDLLVPIKGHGQAKINEAYANGYNDYLDKNCSKKGASGNCRNEAFAAGANMTRQTLSEVFGIPVQYYVSADFVGFEKIIDSLGGIDINVDKPIYDPLYPDERMQGYSPFYVKVGQQHFDGKTALKYARSRETTSDFDRSRRQQQIFVATKDTAMTSGVLSNPKKLIDVVNIVSDHVRTDLSPNEIKTLGEFIKNIDKSKIKNQILSTDSSGPLVSDSSTGTYYIRTKTGNFSELQNLIKNIFNVEPKKEEAKIEIINSTKNTTSSTKLASSLKDEGFNITGTKNSKETYKKTVIYDYSKGEMKETLTFLKESLGAEVVEKTDTAVKVDISIIIGDDYKGITIKK